MVIWIIVDRREKAILTRIISLQNNVDWFLFTSFIIIRLNYKTIQKIPSMAESVFVLS